MLTDAMIDKPKRKASRLGTFGEVLYAVSPKTVDIDPQPGLQPLPRLEGGEEEGRGRASRYRRTEKAGEKQDEMSTEAVAMAYLMQGVHF